MEVLHLFRWSTHTHEDSNKNLRQVSRHGAETECSYLGTQYESKAAAGSNFCTFSPIYPAAPDVSYERQWSKTQATSTYGFQMPMEARKQAKKTGALNLKLNEAHRLTATKPRLSQGTHCQPNPRRSSRREPCPSCI